MPMTCSETNHDSVTPFSVSTSPGRRNKVHHRGGRVARCYEAMFGETFHQSRLQELARLGVLAKDGDTSRGDGRRYYRIIATPELENIRVEPLKSKPPIDAKTFQCPD